MELPYERLAMRGDTMPGGLNAADQVCFQGLAFLYSRYRAGIISKEAASAEKKLIVMRCVEAKRAAAFGEKCSQHAVKLWRNVEQAANAYQTDRTLENADKLIAAIYGIGFP